MIRILIVEDDPMVAEFNKRFVEQVPGYQLQGVAADAKEACRILKVTTVDLILLDIYMPGIDGLELLRQLRKAGSCVDVIILSAASDSETIRQALLQGAVDYVIKPFEFERLQEALLRYQHAHKALAEERVKQEDLDRLFLGNGNEGGKGVLPKGLDRKTLRKVWTQVQQQPESFTTSELASLVGISRVSVRKYLEYLEQVQLVRLEINYGNVGRPTYYYSCVGKKGGDIHF